MAISKFCTQAMLFSSTPTNSEMQPASTSAVSLFFDEKDLDNAMNYSSEPMGGEVSDDKVGVKATNRSERSTTHATVAKGDIHKQLADPFRLSPYRLNQFTKFHRIESASKRRMVQLSKESPICYEGVEEVHLERRKLKSMYSFDRLPNLRRLFLSANEISMIEGLESCTMLEELILDDNLIKQVHDLNDLPFISLHH
jgi:Leucine-rich repeat (LRR) protein